ncbi:methylenetetrahydrofolate reductase [Dehalococcoidia bacterium]|nr:methylenetetrahydrofolate reductase [Dehalococcoidia bacterium]
MKITEKYASGNGPLIALDASPPRSGNPGFTRDFESVDADFICIAYSPGRSVRLDPIVAAATIKWHTRKEVIFSIATRDMNKLAIQTHLLGAQALDMENVLVVRGDDFSEKELERVKAVGDYKPTELLEGITTLNQGIDFKGLKLRAPTSFCPGAVLDLGRNVQQEARLAHRKVEAGAEFLISQAVYECETPEHFIDQYIVEAGHPPAVPIFYGIPVLTKDGRVFGQIPEAIERDLKDGRAGSEIAAALIDSFLDRGINCFYIVPPIQKGTGIRDYAAAQECISLIRKS